MANTIQIIGNKLLDSETFLLLCPEFADTDLQLIDLTLQEAGLEMDPIIWGNLLANGHKYLTAHKLCLSPMGQNARLVQPPGSGGTTTYFTHWHRLLLQVTSGGRVC